MPRVPSAAAAHIGGLIGAQRLQAGLTQDQLAAVSGIDSSNIRAYENGRAMPSIHSLVRLATAVGVEPGSLLDGVTPEMFPMAPQDGRRRAN
ncbi:helix-turn-helix domain-containing protein [Protaetiibacter larvae]|uniref:helix-turn-helix domain-containing protein n=1 Tax=Protaetiibacter larvae TaxID=2592654 RepID=UPI00143D3AE0|nr:helix-turn-helix transcriptional regulator [Protaetiibacter larvae]